MIGVVVFCFVFVAVAGCAAVNRFYVPPVQEAADIEGRAESAPVPVSELTITTWNIGYGGMGAESDFAFDGGEQRRPLTGALVDKNVSGIIAQLRNKTSDIFLFQEVAKPSWITYNRDILQPLIDFFGGYAWSYGADIHTRGMVPPFNVRVGNATFSQIPLEKFERRGLPLEPNFEFGLFRKGYRMHIAHIGDDPAWVIINIHLSAFDSEEDDVRGAQVRAVLDYAQQEYASGKHVVIGGDWNLKLAKTDFAHSSPEKAFFWVRDFPNGVIPNGWLWGIDPTVPTVRGAHKPYIAGENFSLVIDGFLVSPNVGVRDVRTHDSAFEFTDHHPVTANVFAR